MFTEKKNPTTKVEVVQEFVPHIGISSDALMKMHIYTQECTDEIGWLGTAHREGSAIQIDDVFLFEQEVHATTTEITPEGLTSFAEEVIAKGEEGMHIWNNLKMWGHSHVNMGVTPSGQDNSQMETFKEGGHDWFIRLITNKKGVLKIDLYDYRTGVTYLDLPWIELPSEEEMAIRNQIDELYDLLDAFDEERKKEYFDSIKEEMKAKVSKKTYASKIGYGTESKKALGSVTSTQMKKKNGGLSTTKTDTTIKHWGQDLIENDDEVLKIFDMDELFEISSCELFSEVDAYLYAIGRDEFYTDDDIEAIMRVSKKIDWAVTEIE